VVASPGLTDVPVRPPAVGATVGSDGSLPDGHPARLVAVPAGDGQVFVLGSREDVDHSTRSLVSSLLVAVPLSTGVLAVLVWWLVSRVLQPVEDIRAEVDRISAHRLDRRVPVPPTGDEVARLARTMNGMLDRLAAAAERQRRFVADAAHELRSPLARIRTQLEVDAVHPETVDAAATQTAVLTETGRLQRLVDDLLLLARGDAGAADPARAGLVDLDDVVHGLAAVRRTPGGPVIETDAVAPAQVHGNRAQLERAVGNLLDNAVRHAGSRVTITLHQSADGTATLVVADDGPGVPPHAREMVFERFARLDDARSADGGAGLGLAIARDTAVRHGGALALDGGGPPGARFVLTLPGDPVVVGDAAG
jgi:signal transduction histidine kinase